MLCPHLACLSVIPIYFLNIHPYILWDYRFASKINIFDIISLRIVHVTYAFSECFTILKYYVFTSFICSFLCIIITVSENCWSFFNKYVCIFIIIWIWPIVVLNLILSAASQPSAFVLLSICTQVFVLI